MKSTLILLIMMMGLSGCSAILPKPRVEYVPVNVVPVFSEDALQECEKMSKLEDKTGGALTLLLIDTKYKLARCANKHKTLIDSIRAIQKETDEQNRNVKSK